MHEVVVHTGQHYDDNLSSIFFRELDIPKPNRYLGVGSAAHGAQTGRMLEALAAIMEEERPDCTVVFGDTNSTLAGALAAVKLHIPVAHVEAGLRSFNRRMPEEINRVLSDHIAALHFAPTPTAVANLRREGIEAGVHLVGDVMYDAALRYGAVVQATGRNLKHSNEVVVTFHRAENTDDPERLRAIAEALIILARSRTLTIPLHPRTRSALARAGLLDRLAASTNVMEPLGYLDMITVLREAKLVITDSGGVQKEAFFFRVPCVTIRDETEWIELIEAQWNRLAPPTDAASIVRVCTQALDAGPQPEPTVPLFGGGKAGDAIAEKLLTLARA